jgi:polysaccharide transporter, PST family
MAQSAVILVVSQTLAMLLPLVTLPILAKALGVQGFGQVMLAQAVVFFGVVFVDAGFNTESQRRLALASTPSERMQVLIDNLLARSLCALPVALVVLIAAALTPQLPVGMVAIALLHLVGTLMFPQWYFIATGSGLIMGIAIAAGRLISAGWIYAWVQSPDDAWTAVWAASSATIISGLVLLPVLRREWATRSAPLNAQGYKAYLTAVRPTVFSGFFANSTISIPPLLLGWLSNPLQVGLFTSADRLTRAVAHAAGFVEQSLLTPVTRRLIDSPPAGRQLRQRLLLGIALAGTAGVAVLTFAAPTVVQWLYGDRFAGAIPVLQTLGVWLALMLLRRAALLFTWNAIGRLDKVSQFQWAEAALVTLGVSLGGWQWGAMGVASGMIAAELVLLAWLYASLQSQRSAA